MDNYNSLQNLREKIDNLDYKLLTILSQRRKLSIEIAKLKINSNSSIRDKYREKNLLNKLTLLGKTLSFNKLYIHNLFKHIIKDSVLIQKDFFEKHSSSKLNKKFKISYLGSKGSYSYIAALKYASQSFNEIDGYSCSTFYNVVDLVCSGKTDYGLLPIENNSSGFIDEVFDILQNTKLFLVGEVLLNINHCIVAKQNLCFNEIKYIYSHFQPFKQCSNFLLNNPNLKLKYCSSTSEAVNIINTSNCSKIAAIADGNICNIYDLNIIKTNISNQINNITRFIVLSKEKIDISTQKIYKISMSIEISKEYNYLLNILEIFKKNKITLISLTSRPIFNNIKNNKIIFIDIKVNIEFFKIKNALLNLKNLSKCVKILGYYPISKIY
ncbi:MAG: chorismate mutase [Enterobacterales bacterium]